MGLLLLVRHGQASFDADDYDVLSGLGAAQSRRTGAHLRDLGLRPGVVVHGGMRRQRHTAEAMVFGAGWAVPVEADPRWAEFDHLAVVAAYAALPDADVSLDERDRLDHGGLDRRAFQELFEKATGRWSSAGHDEEYAESFAGFTARVRDALGDAARRAGPGELVVVVSSGGPIAAAGAMLVDIGEEPRALSAVWQRLNAVMVNASVTRVVVGSTGARLLSFNEHSFLDADQVTYR